MITDFEGFDYLCQLNGIIDSYHDIRGQHHVASFDVKQLLLASMAITIKTDADIHQHITQQEKNDWQTLAPAVAVCAEEEPAPSIQLTLNSDQASRPVHWQIIEENGSIHEGEWQFDIAGAIQQREFNGMVYYRFHVVLQSLETGYHQLSLKLDNTTKQTISLIVTPETCYQPAPFQDDRKVWGISLQLYALRSRRNWGIGDFTDLQAAIDFIAPLGVDSIGLNPLHALFSHLPENASPYSPSNRDYLNPIYLSIESIDEYARCDEAQQLVNTSDFQNNLKRLRAAELVNYTEVWALKIAVVKLLFNQFQKDSLNPDLQSLNDFHQYQKQKGDDLFKFALFEALQAFFYEQDNTIEFWQQWPAAFRHPESSAVKQWADANNQAIEFYQYLQWRTEQQLSAANAHCEQLGMRIGLYNDLAIGNESFSSACWSDQTQYGQAMGIGAPPDDFNLLGQAWGLPPQLPQQLKDQQYQLFINTLRANMRHAGALRIDHVMGLMRLYWIPDDIRADLGTYVNYPFKDLLGILALESQRNHCLIIGEDLGTVPDEVRHQLWLKKVFSYRVLFFEKDWHHGHFKQPHEYPPYALCTAGSHDLPTLKGYWQELDIDIRERLNLYPSDDVKHQQRNARGGDRYQLKLALFEQQLIDEHCLHDNTDQAMTTELCLAIQRYLARSQSLFMMVQIEDLLLQTQQLNVPGTINEYPNWRYKVSIDVEDWNAHKDLKASCLAISQERAL